MKSAWEEIYRGGEFLIRNLHPEMKECTEFFKRREARRILDLGCGSGRHTVYLASMGFDVYGLNFITCRIDKYIKRSWRKRIISSSYFT